MVLNFIDMEKLDRNSSPRRNAQEDIHRTCNYVFEAVWKSSVISINIRLFQKRRTVYTYFNVLELVC